MDKGCAKPCDVSGNTEAAWQRRRRASVDAAVKPRRLSFSTEAHDDAGDLDGWTPKHEQLLQRQDAKARKRKALAHMDGVLLEPEITPQARPGMFYYY